MKMFHLSAAIAVATLCAPHALAQNVPHRDDQPPQTQPQTQPQPQPTTTTGNDMNREMGANDAWITTKVKSALLADEDVSGLKIDVDTRDGVVALSGMAGSQKEIDEARRIAQSIEGVKRVDVKALKRETGKR